MLSMKPQSIRALGILHVLLMMSSVGYAQLTPIPDPNFWVTDGPVHAVHKTGNTIYIGGNFSRVGPNAPYGAKVDSVTGMPDVSFAKPNGSVLAVVPDGNGGWFIGGEFTAVGGEDRKHLARINGNGTLHPWSPSANDLVRVLSLMGDVLYAGGDFTEIDGISTRFIAALDAATGVPKPWSVYPNDRVRTIAPYGGKLYLGGDFTKIGGQTRNHVAALDPVVGTLLNWNADVDDTVRAVAPSGMMLVVGGDFSTVGGLGRTVSPR